MEKAVLYLRFSPRPDAEEAMSLETQEQRCSAYCRERDMEIVSVIKDPETSARKIPLEEREGGRELLTMISFGIQNIVVQKMDRLFRSIDGRVHMDSWSQRGVSLHLADQGGCSINCGTSMGRFLAGQILLFAELEPAMTAERTSGAMKSYQSKGRRMSARLPFGWKLGGVVYTTSGKKQQLIEEDANEKAAIETIRDLAAMGRSTSDIIRILEEKFILYRGKPWHHENVRRILKRKMP
jgi:site-specific DNA recombinase